MIIQDLTTLKINKLTQKQYDREYANGNIDKTALYLTPDEDIEIDQTYDAKSANAQSGVAVAEAINLLNIKNSTGTSSLQQVQDSSNVLDIASKNPHAAELDTSLTDNEPVEASGAFSAAFGGKSAAQGKRSFSCGTTTLAKGSYSFAAGDNSVALGNASFVCGAKGAAYGYATFVTGLNSVAIGQGAAAFGSENKAEGDLSFVGGQYSLADSTAKRAFVFGTGLKAIMNDQSIVGIYNNAKSDTLFEVGNGASDTSRSTAFSVMREGNAIKIGETALTEPQLKELINNNITNIKDSTGDYSIQQVQDSGYTGLNTNENNPHAVALDSTLSNTQTIGASGKFASSFGGTSSAQGKRSHAEGSSTIAKGSYSHAEGVNGVALGSASHAEGHTTVASSEGAHAEGNGTQATGESAHAEGYYTIASGDRSHAEGWNTTAKGEYSHAEGQSCNASGAGAHAEGMSTLASDFFAHAEGHYTKATHEYTHAEGSYSVASGLCAHAEGDHTTASGASSHAGGVESAANGLHSFAHGNNIIAAAENQFVVGKFNKVIEEPEDEKDSALFIVGNGNNIDERNNALEVYKDGTVKAQYVDISNPSNHFTINSNDINFGSANGINIDASGGMSISGTATYNKSEIATMDNLIQSGTSLPDATDPNAPKFFVLI